MSLALAFLKRDFQVQRSYRLQFLYQFGGSFLTLATFAFLARLVPGNQESLRPYGSDYFTFVLVGTAVFGFLSTSLNSFADTLAREQTTGTLESLLSTPNDPRVVLVGGAIWPFCLSVLQLAIYFVIGVFVFGARISAPRFLLLVVVLAIALTTFSALGLLTAALLIQTKRATLIATAFGSAFTLLGGVTYPVAVLPHWLQGIAMLLPITYGLDAVRASLLTSLDTARIGKDVLALVTFAVVLLPAALWLFGWSTDRARREGSLSHY
jgi:ABC-2 type transport system permease protein